MLAHLFPRVCCRLVAFAGEQGLSWPRWPFKRDHGPRSDKRSSCQGHLAAGQNPAVWVLLTRADKNFSCQGRPFVPYLLPLVFCHAANGRGHTANRTLPTPFGGLYRPAGPGPVLV